MAGLTRLDLSGNALRTLRPGRYLSSGLAELRLAMNQLKRLPAALRGARGTLRTLCLHGNPDLELTRDDADLLAVRLAGEVGHDIDIHTRIMIRM